MRVIVSISLSGMAASVIRRQRGLKPLDCLSQDLGGRLRQLADV